MLSKMAREQPMPLAKEQPLALAKKDNRLSEIAKKDLTKCKVVELKALAKELGIKSNYNKGELIKLIQHHVRIVPCVIKVQSLIRRKLVYIWQKLKGNYQKCVNDTDFYTLEPLDEIPYLYYMQYVTEQPVKYGFNIMSLCSLAVKNKSFENPYTRENMKHTIGNGMGRIIRLTNILLPGNQLMEDIKTLYNGKDSSNVIHSLVAPTQQQHQVVQRRSRDPAANAFNELIMRLRSYPLERRVSEFFMAIDNLGNYTQKEWLTRLTPTQMYYALIKINNIWIRIPVEARVRICPYIQPFHRTVLTINTNDMQYHDVLECIVKIGEIMVHSAVQKDDRVLGAMYFLMGLTVASMDARMSIPWLHEGYFEMMERPVQR